MLHVANIGGGLNCFSFGERKRTELLKASKGSVLSFVFVFTSYSSSYLFGESAH